MFTLLNLFKSFQRREAKRNPLAPVKKLNTTTSFFHWKRIVLAHHPKATFQITEDRCIARLGNRLICGIWDVKERCGEVLHTPKHFKDFTYAQ